MVLAFYVCFFFFKQKTAYEMRISDWSSDVCSSDLLTERGARTGSAFGSCLPSLSPHPVEYSRARPGRDAPRSWQAGGCRPNSYSNSRMSHPLWGYLILRSTRYAASRNAVAPQHTENTSVSAGAKCTPMGAIRTLYGVR